MIFIARDGILEGLQCRSSIDQRDALSTIKSGRFDFLVLMPDSRMHAIIREVDPTKLRLIYDKECGPIPYTGGIITTISWTSFQNIEALAGQDKYVYYSRLGFVRHPKNWLNRDDDKTLSEKYMRLASFIPERRVLFYGTPSVQMKGLFAEHGLKIIRVGFAASPSKSLIDVLVESRCFAVAGRDGMSLQCWRDTEVSLAAVPYLRGTTNHRLADLFDPFGGPVYVGDSENMESVINRMFNDLEEGFALSLALKSRFAARMVGSSDSCWRCREALVCDHEFLKKNITAPASAFIERAKIIREARDPLVMDSRFSCLSSMVFPWGGQELFQEKPDPSIQKLAAMLDGPGKVVQLAAGQKVFDNRSYEFTDVGPFSGWNIIKSGNKTCMNLTVDAPAGSTIHLAIDSRMESITGTSIRLGWKIAGRLKSNDPGMVFMAVLEKTFKSHTKIIVSGGAMANPSLISPAPFGFSMDAKPQNDMKGIVGHWPDLTTDKP